MDVGFFLWSRETPHLRTEGAVEIHLVSYNSCISRVSKHSQWHLVLCFGCWDVVEVPVVLSWIFVGQWFSTVDCNKQTAVHSWIFQQLTSREEVNRVQRKPLSLCLLLSRYSMLGYGMYLVDSCFCWASYGCRGKLCYRSSFFAQIFCRDMLSQKVENHYHCSGIEEWKSKKQVFIDHMDLRFCLAFGFRLLTGNISWVLGVRTGKNKVGSIGIINHTVFFSGFLVGLFPLKNLNLSNEKKNVVIWVI